MSVETVTRTVTQLAWLGSAPRCAQAFQQFLKRLVIASLLAPLREIWNEFGFRAESLPVSASKHSHSRMASKVAKPIGNKSCLASLTSSCLAFCDIPGIDSRRLLSNSIPRPAV